MLSNLFSYINNTYSLFRESCADLGIEIADKQIRKAIELYEQLNQVHSENNVAFENNKDSCNHK